MHLYLHRGVTINEFVLLRSRIINVCDLYVYSILYVKRCVVELKKMELTPSQFDFPQKLKN